ncbi:MAG TPA: hypothetical protein VHE09_14980, partial [Rhizomicrobium sp.]|nr:hypothetical protein [Rhizomicrobium sp.]
NVLRADAAAEGRSEATDIFGLRGVVGFTAFAARFAAAFFGAVFFADSADCFLVGRLTVFFATFLAFLGARVLAFALTLFFAAFRALAFLLRFFAAEVLPAARDSFALRARDFLADFFLAEATTNSL